jgi:hypothetical protein
LLAQYGCAFSYFIAFLYEHLFDNAVNVNGHFSVHLVGTNNKHHLVLADLVAGFDQDISYFTADTVAERRKFEFVSHI